MKSANEGRPASTLRLVGGGATYGDGTVGLHPSDLSFRAGEFCILLGPSGAGKSTLLRMLNLLVMPTEGTVEWAADGTSTPLASARAIRDHRRRTAMIFQQHHLIPRLSALKNVEMGRLGHHPAWRTIWGLPAADRKIAIACLDRVGLADKALARCSALSGGQQQRVGIARALAQQPHAILADEPIASLDPTSAEHVLRLLRRICHEDGIPAVASLHQLEAARGIADRIVGLDSGRIVFDGPPAALMASDIARIYGSIASQ
ncbi:phosphonate ABC transporter ATP-binding protein [Jannaschia sp. 2305UL9-9]|uniref:phosphonate ABC transporter ATP-binding protein n=1 Tax=Jannaschia sp. 2305UL9-9 TaxID=3121638 RepID=UPI0035286242